MINLFRNGVAQTATKDAFKEQEESYLSQEETFCSFLLRPGGRIEGCCKRSVSGLIIDDELRAAPIRLDTEQEPCIHGGDFFSMG